MQTNSITRPNRAEKFSKIAGAYFKLAVEHKGNGKFEHFLLRAEKLYGIAINEEPNSLAHRNNRALVRKANGDFEGAFLDFEAAKKLCNGNKEQLGDVEKNLQQIYDRTGVEGRKKIGVEKQIDAKGQKILVEPIQVQGEPAVQPAGNVKRNLQAETLSEIAGRYFTLALENRKDGKLPDSLLKSAENFYSLAIKADAGSPIYRNNRALVREAMGDFTGAFLDFEAAKWICCGNKHREEKPYMSRNGEAESY